MKPVKRLMKLKKPLTTKKTTNPKPDLQGLGL
jgi:hypothetical protein